ncbi:uncharacterized protein LOC129614246 [Condylostylus longicornis]|uniref:uncharacterized protein LOC129614246 n=1 Tax=Condylostylus longicornis TaxID=2530218 RepID=UPI00244DD4C0|nr:uncharacterized protein LOC129614246 [Condylostylus longicornis]
MNKLLVAEVLFLIFFATIVFKASNVVSLECYVCSNQTGNTEKCLNTIKTCDPGQDACQTEIRWGSMPYFSEGAQKQYYVSKKCSTKHICQKTRSHYMRYCTHIWYEDWNCFECCQGDRCNYYVISAGNKSFSYQQILYLLVILFLSKTIL